MAILHFTDHAVRLYAVVVDGIRQRLDPQARLHEAVAEVHVSKRQAVFFVETTERFESVSAHQHEGVAGHVMEEVQGPRSPEEADRGVVRSRVGSRVAGTEERHTCSRYAIRTGEAGGAYEPRDRVREQDVVIVEEQDPLSPSRGHRRVARRPVITVLLADHAPAALVELGFERIEGHKCLRILAAVVDQDRFERRIVLGEHAVHRQADQLGPFVMDDADRDQRRRHVCGLCSLLEPSGRGLDGLRPGVPARPDLLQAIEISARPNRTQRRIGEFRNAFAEVDVIGCNERAAMVLGGDEFRCASDRGRQEGNARLKTLQDRHRRALPQ